MYIRPKSRGMGDAGPGCLVGAGPLDIGQQYCASVDSVTVTASAGTGPLCFSSWMFPWLGRLQYDPSISDFRCVDLLTYNGVVLPAAVGPVVTLGVAFLLARALFGGGR